MSPRLARWLAVLVLAEAFTLGVIATWAGGGRQMPVCQEDAILLGTGQFERGRWSSYVCGPAIDDIAPDLQDVGPDGALWL